MFFLRYVFFFGFMVSNETLRYFKKLMIQNVDYLGDNFIIIYVGGFVFCHILIMI